MEIPLKDKTMLKIAITISFFGLLLLFLIMFFKTEKIITINEIDNHKDMTISIKGTIVNFSYAKNNTKILIKQECFIEGIIFNKDMTNFFKSNNSEHINSEYIFRGKIQEFNNKNTLIIYKIQQVIE